MLWGTKPPFQFTSRFCMSVCWNFEVWENLGSLSPIKSGKLYHAILFPSVFGSCNWKMLLVKSWDNTDPFWKIYDLLSSKSYSYYRISFLLTFSQNVTRDFCFDVKTINFNRFHNRKTFFISCFFQTLLIETLNKKYFSLLIIHEKIYYFIIF